MVADDCLYWGGASLFLGRVLIGFSSFVRPERTGGRAAGRPRRWSVTRPARLTPECPNICADSLLTVPKSDAARVFSRCRRQLALGGARGDAAHRPGARRREVAPPEPVAAPPRQQHVLPPQHDRGPLFAEEAAFQSAWSRHRGRKK